MSILCIYLISGKLKMAISRFLSCNKSAKKSKVFPAVKSDDVTTLHAEEEAGCDVAKKLQHVLCVDVLPTLKEQQGWCLINWARAQQNQWMMCASSEDGNQPGHPSNLSRVVAVRLKKSWDHSYPQSTLRRLWSDCVDVQADLSLCLAHMWSCWFCKAPAHIWSVILMSRGTQ